MLNIEELKLLNASGLTQKEMAEKLKVSRSTIQRNLRKLQLNTPNYHNSLKFDNTVFDKIDSEEKAYWLGFLYADGSISKTTNSVELSLAEKDLEHLEKYRIFLKNIPKVKIEKIYCQGKEFTRCRLIVTNQHFKKQLINLGCIPNKSLVLKFPENIFERDALKYDFLRGYIDGDGSITFTKSGRLRIDVIGTKQFLTEVLNIFPEFKHLKKDARWKNNIYYLSCSCSNAEKILTKLYKNSSIYLQRKYNRLAVLSSNW